MTQTIVILKEQIGPGRPTVIKVEINGHRWSLTRRAAAWSTVAEAICLDKGLPTETWVMVRDWRDADTADVVDTETLIAFALRQPTFLG